MEKTKKSEYPEPYNIPDVLVTPLLNPSLPETNYYGMCTCICEILSCLFGM